LTSKSHCLYHLSRSPYGYGRPLVPLSDLSLGVGVSPALPYCTPDCVAPERLRRCYLTAGVAIPVAVG
jgi:hypothetical protein